jgi:hypothetical protein
MEHPAGKVIVVHPEHKPVVISLEELELAESNPVNRQIRMGSKHINVRECLIIKMYWSNHPERTISYRFEERPTGKVFVFLTDHENTDGIPRSLKNHL